jgi:hypothetical protein
MGHNSRIHADAHGWALFAEPLSPHLVHRQELLVAEIAEAPRVGYVIRPPVGHKGIT